MKEDQAALQDAIGGEKYEEAATLRDQLRHLEQPPTAGEQP